MARQKNLAKMSIHALLTLKDDVLAALGNKASELKSQLSKVAGPGKSPGRPRKGSAIAGRKVPPKYRGPKGELWAGRGAHPVWMREAIKEGKKAEDFLIAQPSGAKKSATKKAKKAGRKKR
jgi:DNA-binding protein H-NS